MGLRYRKSFGKGPFRINVSKSGIGWSIGSGGARATKKAGGGYRTTIGANGISYTNDYGRNSSKKKTKGGAGCLSWILIILSVFGLVGILASCEPDNPSTTGPSRTQVVEQEEPAIDGQKDGLTSASSKMEEAEPLPSDPDASNTNNKTSEDASIAISDQSNSSANIVYYTDTGSKYHRAGCRHLSDSKHETTLEDAQALGLTACGTCH